MPQLFPGLIVPVFGRSQLALVGTSAVFLQSMQFGAAEFRREFPRPTIAEGLLHAAE